MQYSADYAATGRFMRTDAGLRRAIRTSGGEIRSAAEGIAPVLTGNYLRSLEVVDDDATDRMGAAVVSDDPAAAPLEFGNAKTDGRGQNVLTRAAEIAGFQVDRNGA